MEQKETARLALHAFVTLMNYLEAANKAQFKLSICKYWSREKSQVRREDLQIHTQHWLLRGTNCFLWVFEGCDDVFGHSKCIKNIGGGGQISIFHLLSRMWSPVVITCLFDYISDLTKMQILIFKVTASSSISASLPTEASLHTVCVKYCFIWCALSKCVFITPPETGAISPSWRRNSGYL